MELINYTLPSILTSGNVVVEVLRGELSLSLDQTYYIGNREDYVTGYCSGLFTLPFNSILIGGLGLGLIPYYLSSNYENKEIDVLENNAGVINVVNQMGYMPSEVTIIEADALSHTTTKQYDIILMDLWWFYDEVFSNDKAAILSNYSTNLTQNGKFYFPISREII